MIHSVDLFTLDEVLSTLRALRAYNHPSRRSYQRIRSWFDRNTPLAPSETEFVEWREELISLTSGVSETFDGRIQSFLAKIDCKLTRVCNINSTAPLQACLKLTILDPFLLRRAKREVVWSTYDLLFSPPDSYLLDCHSHLTRQYHDDPASRNYVPVNSDII